MYKIERRPSGYLLSFSGAIDSQEMNKWYTESKVLLDQETSKSFGVIIDMRNLKPLSFDAGKIMNSGQKLYKEKGMNRSAVILNNQDICTQFKNIAIQSGIYAFERYIDASTNHNPADTAIKWVKDGVDPDKK